MISLPFRREPAIRFAMFRIAFSCVLLEDLAHFYLNRTLLADSLFGFLPLGPLLLAWICTACFLAIGWRTFQFALLNYIFAVVVLGSGGPFSQLAGDAVAIGLSLLLLFLPCGDSLSLDCWREAKRPSLHFAAFRWLLVTFLSVVYVDSALYKLMSPMWRHGLGIAAPMGLPSLVWTNASWIEAFPPWLLKVGGWSVIAFELSFPILYAWLRTRTAVVLIGIVLHASIAIVYPFPVFSGLMLAIYAGLLPEAWYKPLARLDDYRRPRLPKTRWLNLRQRYRLMTVCVCLWMILRVGLFAPKLTSDPAFQKYHALAYRVIFSATGITRHAVFSDSLFSGYDYQIRLVADKATFPYGSDNLFLPVVRDRLWEFWWKRTQAPWVQIGNAQSNLLRCARFFSSPTTIVIEARPQRVVLEGIDTHLFRENNAAVWRQIGLIAVAPDGGQVLHWNEPVSSDDSVGGYMNRILAEK